MRDLISKKESYDTRKKHGSNAAEVSDARMHASSFSTAGTSPIFRKASCACGGGCPSCQAKSSDLKVSSPTDTSEIEADRVADKVMRMQAPEPKDFSSAKNAVQRKENNTGSISLAPPNVRDVINSSSGKSLDKSTRSFMEPRFNQDFGNVKIHDSDKAAESARSINALAYTVGDNIVFDSGQFDPHSDPGKRLLAHELTHVTQQSNSIRRYRDPKSANSINYGVYDTKGLKEESFNVTKDKDTKPWIEMITITLDSKKQDKDGHDYWAGSGVATYHDNAAKLPDVSLNLSGGPVGDGKTVAGSFKVTHIEGYGYMSSAYSAKYDPVSPTGWGRKYVKKDEGGNMNYAVFFYKGQALHSGYVNTSSHGCVHIDPGAQNRQLKMQQVNYHSVAGLTKVKIQYK